MSDAWSVDEDIEENRHNWSEKAQHRPPRDGASRSDAPKVIDLFCGPGGLSQGLEQAGFESVLGVDIHEPSIETFQRNHPHAHAILGDIREINKRADDDRDIFDVIDDERVDVDTLLGTVAEDALSGEELAVLTAGIPCQGFSIANRKQHDEDERNYLFEEFVRAVKILEPRFVLVENVSTMKAAKDGEFVEAVVECLQRLGYATDYRVLSAEEYGVPQKRKRLFFMGARNGHPLTWPKPTHADDPRTISEALSDLPAVDAGEQTERYDSEPLSAFAESMRETPAGADIEDGRLHNHEAPNHRQTTVDRVKNTEPGEPMYDRFRQRIRLHPDQPGPTIIAGGIRPQFQYGHPEQSRGLTVRERARIQSFPDHYVFEGGVVQGRVQTGMAVPPLLAQRLGEAIATNYRAKPFREKLLEWGEENRREFPWRTPDCSPYEVFVAQMLLQRALPENAEPVYRDFTDRYPDFGTLKGASEDELAEILRPLEPNDEYAKAFRKIASKLVFSGIPDSEEKLLDLPHVERYVANATLCFGFGRRRPVVDENVARLYARVFDLNVEDGHLDDEYLWDFAGSLLPEDDFERYSMALLDHAAEICTATSPDCDRCPVSDECDCYE
ncbi:DNA cytosine methyltransferase [Haloprofundus halobius]|uniref:DNA cytosine methyltransferase n=1 Tax=Haloprofundus halobius TaxID=2876194 RepID=UPI001CCBC704|nr:DNA cytosine methyltransferase [Haloprofundus halobius]